MISVIGYSRLADGEIARLSSEFRKMLEATRKEPGCIYYNFAVDVLV
jgi:quinol monooxygenase YgiN